MISVTQAQDLIAQKVVPLSPETVTLERAHGRVLREPITAPEDLPPFDRSAMDGYAIRRDDLSEVFKVIDEIRAGVAMDRHIEVGQAIRIFTGARLPGKDLKVVMQEHVEPCAEGIRLRKRSMASNIRERGEDARAGELLLAQGTLIDAAALGLLASIGKTSFLVSRSPRIFHLTTGDEIVAPEQTPAQGQIRNSNAPLISGLCREFGAGPVTHFHAGDELASMIETVAQAKPNSFDVILISGGSGAGAYDFSAELFRSLGATIHFREVNVRPGKPLIFGTTPSQVIFGLPGNALSHFVCFHLFVRRCLDHLLGHPPARVTAGFLAEPMMDTINSRETWWPGRARFSEGQVALRALPWKSSGDITHLSEANALIRIPAQTPGLDAGAKIDLLYTRPVT